MTARRFVLTVLALAGCSGAQSPPQPVPAGTTVYACPDGFRFSVRTRGDSAAVKLPTQTLTLPHVPAASGEKYQAGDALLWRKGDEARLETVAGKYDSCLGTVAETPWDEARLLGIEFRAVGQEPGWLLEMDRGHSIQYTRDYGTTQVIAPTPPAYRFSNPGATWSYSSQSEGRALEVLLTPERCTDSMSGETFPYVVRVSVDRDDGVKGCGRMLVTGDLIGVYWKLVELDGGPVIELDPYGRSFLSFFPAFEPHLRLTDRGRAVAGGSGCKEFSGPAEVDGKRVKLGPLSTRPVMLISAQPATRTDDSMTQAIVDTTTESPCRPELVGQEHRFLRALESADSLEAKLDTLTLYAGARPVGRFQAQYLR